MASISELTNALSARPAARVLVLLLTAAWLWNCSFSSTVGKTTRTIKRTSRKLSREVKFTGRDFRHRVAIGDFETLAQEPGGAIKAFFDKGLPDHLSGRCSVVLVGRSGKSAPATLLTAAPRLSSGQIDAYALSIIGRQLGVNAVIVGSLKNMRKIEELRGILNKETIHSVRMVVRIEVYQPLTATKIMDSIYRRDVPIEDLEFDRTEEPTQWNIPNLDDALSDMLEEVGADVCDAILDQPWSGFITAVEGEKIVISAGSRAGLKPGVQLSVFESSKTIAGTDGQRFFLPGANTGRIKILAVTEDRSEAQQIDGEPVKVGNSVRPGK